MVKQELMDVLNLVTVDPRPTAIELGQSIHQTSMALATINATRTILRIHFGLETWKTPRARNQSGMQQMSMPPEHFLEVQALELCLASVHHQTKASNHQAKSPMLLSDLVHPACALYAFQQGTHDVHVFLSPLTF
jgi:hypothetical protein